MKKNNKEENSDIVKKRNEDEPIKDDDKDSEFIPDDILEAFPVEERGKLVSIIKQSMFSGIIKRSNPITERITEEHITKLISNSDQQDIRDRKERNHERYFTLGIIILSLVFIGFLVVFLKDKENLLITVITAILSFIGGFGIGKSIKNRE